MTRPSSPDLTNQMELEQTQAKVTKANQHLTHLENEIQAVQKRRATLSDEITAETAALVAQREQELSRMEQAARKHAQELERTISTTREQIVIAERQKATLQSDIAALEADVALLAQSRDATNQQLRELNTTLAAKERRATQVDARIQFLEGGIQPLLERQSTLNEQIRTLENTRADLEGKIATLDSRYITRKNQIEAEITNLLEKQQELEVAQAGMLRQYNQMSEDIATRIKIADEREEILKRREFKVAQDEKMVARNAGLINL